MTSYNQKLWVLDLLKAVLARPEREQRPSVGAQ
jgi:hypothetical protein